jgi:hypothetical protein
MGLGKRKRKKKKKKRRKKKEEELCRTFSDELHVTVFDSIVDHLHEMTRTFFTYPIATRSTIFNLCSDCLEDGLHMRPSSRVSSWHDGRA